MMSVVGPPYPVDDPPVAPQRPILPLLRSSQSRWASSPFDLLVCEARSDYQSAIAAYGLAEHALKVACDSKEVLDSYYADVSINLASVLCQVACFLYISLCSPFTQYGCSFHRAFKRNRADLLLQMLLLFYFTREKLPLQSFRFKKFEQSIVYYLLGNMTDSFYVRAGYELDAAHEREKLEIEYN